MNAPVLILFVWSIAFCLFIWRNNATCDIRIAIIKTATEDDLHAGLELYALLPSYDAMLFHPAYWLKWSEADWREYIARSQS